MSRADDLKRAAERMQGSGMKLNGVFTDVLAVQMRKDAKRILREQTNG